MSNCLRLIDAMPQADQDALLTRLDNYQAVGMTPKQAQLEAAKETLKQLEAEMPVVQQSQRTPLGFYSALAEGIESIQTKQQPAGGWLAQIKGLVNKGAVKQDEVEWSGLTDWLTLQIGPQTHVIDVAMISSRAGAPTGFGVYLKGDEADGEAVASFNTRAEAEAFLGNGKIPKQQVLDYLDANGVQVQETVLGAPEKSFDIYHEERGGRRGAYIMSYGAMEDAEAWVEDRDADEGEFMIEELADEDNPTGTKYEQYSLPGGQNYREVLLTLPDRDEAARTKRFGEIADEMNATKDRARYEELRNERTALAEQKNTQQYQSSHWDQKNVLAHLRVNDRVDADGAKVLFVEEMQSDWGQDGKKKGFSKDTTDWTAESLSEPDAGFTHWQINDASGNYVTKIVGGSKESAIRKAAEGIPLAPFISKTDGWLNLALKRAIIMAVEGGYSKVAFVNGDQSADRYSLEKHADQIILDDAAGGRNTLIMRKNGSNVHVVHDVAADKLPDYVGKELSERLLSAQLDDYGRKSLAGIELKVGGEGMRTFYDSIVPNAAKALLKKLGGRQMEDVKILGPAMKAGGDWLDQPGFTITTALREKVSAGVPLFSKRDPYANAPDNLMGYRKYGPQKAFGEQAYKHVEFVRVSWNDGETMVEAMTGLNKPHALERARRNWKSAKIEAITRAEAEAEDPTIGKDVDAALKKSARDLTDTPEFKTWSQGLDLVEAGEEYAGGPAVFTVYHGTTHSDITQFERVGQSEGFLGKGPYFTTDPEDASENYAGVGPDLTIRIERTAENIADTFEEDDYVATQMLEDYFQAKGIKAKITDKNFGEFKVVHGNEAINHAATQAVKGDTDGLMMKAYVRMSNPADTTGNSAPLMYEATQDDDGNVTDETGTAVDWIMAAREVGERYGISMEEHINDVLTDGGDSMSSAEISMKAAFNSVQSRLGEAYDDQGELLSAGAIFSEIAEEAGYDGVIMDAGLHFGPRKGFGGVAIKGMKGVKTNTLHLVPFSATQVKSATGNSGAFDPANPDIRKSQRDQTKTAAFKKWFGDSKVVDADGKPLVVYHGTALGGFSTFDIKTLGGRDNSPGAWFSDSEIVASTYSGWDRRDSTSAIELREKHGLTTRAMYKVYLRLENPMVVNYKGADALGLDKNGDDVLPRVDAWVHEARAKGHDGLIVKRVVDRGPYRTGELSRKDGTSNLYVAFNPTQIKSAIGNDGSFDPKNPDIRKSIRPEASRFDDMVYKMQNKMIDTKRVVDAIMASVGQIADDLNVYLQEELFHGRAAKRVADFGKEELKPLMEQIKQDGYTIGDVEEYLQARHAPEANRVIAQRNPNDPGLQDGGSGMTNAAAAAYMASLSADDAQKLSGIAAQVDAIIRNTRQLYVDYKLESQDTVDAWEQMFQNYIPLQREDKEGRMGIGQGFSVKGKETKGRTGSTRRVVDVLANIALQREKLIVRGEKNRVATALVGLATANPDPDLWSVGPPPSTRVYDPKTNTVVDRVDPMYKSRDEVLVAKIADANGVIMETAVVFNQEDPRALRMVTALKNLDANNLEGVLAVSAKITRYFSAINTQYNPVFGVVNLVRDVQGAMINLGETPLAGKRLAIAKNTLSALAGIYADMRAERNGTVGSSPWAQEFEEFELEGGQTGFRDLFKTSSDRAEALQKILTPDAWMNSKLGKTFTVNGKLKVPMSEARKGAGWIFDWLSDYNGAMENAVRLSAYKEAKDQGMSKQQAASLAKNLTVNFNRKGQAGQQAGALYAFFNAAMQGTARMGQTLFTMQPGKPKTIRLSSTGKRIVYGGILLGAIQALALAASGFDDKDPPEFLRERSLILPTRWSGMGPKKGYVSIPMPLGYHVIPGIGRHAAEFALSGFEKPQKRIVSMIGMFMDAFNPIGNAGLSMQTVAPTALDPFVALRENKDWTGKPIARTSSNQAIPGHTQFKDTATAPAKWLAEAINLITGGNDYVAGVLSPTPDQIDYLIGQVTGGVGRELSKVEQTVKAVVTGEELPTFKIPLAGRFFGNADSQASQASAFYDNVNKLNELETEVKGMRKDGKAAEAAALIRSRPDAYMIQRANVAERQVQRLRREKRELLKKGAERSAIKAKEAQITETMKRLNAAMAQ